MFTICLGFESHSLIELVHECALVGCAGGVAEVGEGAEGGGFSSDAGVGGASLRGGILSLMASSPLASANDVILWFGENPWSAAKTKFDKDLKMSF